MKAEAAVDGQAGEFGTIERALEQLFVVYRQSFPLYVLELRA